MGIDDKAWRALESLARELNEKSPEAVARNAIVKAKAVGVRVLDGLVSRLAGRRVDTAPRPTRMIEPGDGAWVARAIAGVPGVPSRAEPRAWTGEAEAGPDGLAPAAEASRADPEVTDRSPRARVVVEVAPEAWTGEAPAPIAPQVAPTAEAPGATMGIADDRDAAPGPTSGVVDDRDGAAGPTSGVVDDRDAAAGPTSGVVDDRDAAAGPTSGIVDDRDGAPGLTSLIVEAHADSPGPTSLIVEAHADSPGPTSLDVEAHADSPGPTSPIVVETRHLTQGSTDQVAETHDAAASADAPRPTDLPPDLVVPRANAPLPSLPPRYGIDRVVLLAGESEWVFVYWETDPARVAGAQRAELRLLSEEGALVGRAYVDPVQGRQHLRVPARGRRYHAELVHLDGTLLSRSRDVIVRASEVT